MLKSKSEKIDSQEYGTFSIRSRSLVKKTHNGNLYLECTTDKGLIAFWGDNDNKQNIISIAKEKLPFVIDTQYVRSRWRKHTYWVRQRHKVTILDIRPVPTKYTIHSPKTDKKCFHIRSLIDMLPFLLLWLLVLGPPVIVLYALLPNEIQTMLKPLELPVKLLFVILLLLVGSTNSILAIPVRIWQMIFRKSR